MCHRGNRKGVGLAERGVSMVDNVDEVWGVVPCPAELVFVLGPQGCPCPLYMLCAITSDEQL
jgi:hypothetical protein